MVRLHKDFSEFVESLIGNGVEFLIVGAHALAFYGHPRSTGDLDIFVRPTVENARRILRSLNEFGFGGLDISEDDLAGGTDVIQLGVAPVQIDLLTTLTAVDFDDAWTNGVRGTINGLTVVFISKEDMIQIKRRSGGHGMWRMRIFCGVANRAAISR